MCTPVSRNAWAGLALLGLEPEASFSKIYMMIVPLTLALRGVLSPVCGRHKLRVLATTSTNGAKLPLMAPIHGVRWRQMAGVWRRQINAYTSNATIDALSSRCACIIRARVATSAPVLP